MICPSPRREVQGGVVYRRPFFAPILALLVAVSMGCGSSKRPDLPGPVSHSGPHGGQVFAIPDSLGYVELFSFPIEREAPEPQAEPEVKKTKSKQPPIVVPPPKKMLIAYFLQDDQKSILKPSPTEITVEIEPVPFRPQICPLSPLSDPDDPKTSGRFVYLEPLEDRAEIAGVLKASLNNRLFEVQFSVQ